MKSMAAANKPTALLELDLSTRFETGEPMFMQILDEEARQMRVSATDDNRDEVVAVAQAATVPAAAP